MVFKKIALIMAMRDEASPLIKKMNLTHKGKLFGELPPELFSGRIGDAEIFLILSGRCNTFGVDHIGTQPAVLTTLATIERIKPQIIINAGTAGGFSSQGSRIGDVFLSYPHVCFHDRRINIPGFKEYGMGFYSTFDCVDISKYTNLKLGIVSTGNSLDYTEEDLHTMNYLKCSVKDMEAAAVAWVSSLYKVPFLAVKAITDLIDNDTPTEIEFLKNLEIASNTLSLKTYEVVKYIVEKL